MGRRLTPAECLERMRAAHGDRYEYDMSGYTGATTPIRIRCPQHGWFRQSPHKHYGGQGCPSCYDAARRGATQRKTTAEWVAAARRVHGDRYDYSLVDYKNNVTPVTVVCHEHGPFRQRPANHLSDRGCPVCGRKIVDDARRITQEQFVRDSVTVHGTKYDYSSTRFVDVASDVVITCPRHGEFSQPAMAHKAGHGCPKCPAADGRSAVEKTLAAHYPAAVVADRTVLGGKEIDLLVSPSLGVEVNGRYWHSEERGTHKNYHLNKYLLAASKGVHLVQFWEDELVDMDLAVSTVNAKLKITPRRIHARKCILSELDYPTAAGFMGRNHLQGTAISSVRYGLYYHGELVAAMTFARPRFSKNYDWELVRFASARHTVVVGGASKLFRAFTRAHSGTVVSYANRRWSDGGLYRALGFVEAGASEPNYEWFKNGVAIPRYKSQKRKLPKLLGHRFDPEKTEAENMRAAGYFRTWDCGNFIFVYEI